MVIVWSILFKPPALNVKFDSFRVLRSSPGWGHPPEIATVFIGLVYLSILKLLSLYPDLVQPTLDVNSAHPNLYLSEGNTVAKMMSEPKNYPDHPDRFDHWQQVRNFFCSGVTSHDLD